MKVTSLLSGGKDSVYSTFLAQMQGLEVVETLTMASKSSESWMFHYPNPEIAEIQSDLMDIPNKTIKTEGKKEKELKDLKKALKKSKEDKGIEGIISGAVESEYQKSRLDYMGEELGLKNFAPLWRKDPYKLMKEQIESGFKYIVIQVSSGGLDESWLGKEIDLDTLKELKKLNEEIGIHIAGEGGEYEAAVLEAPIFKGIIEVKEAEKKMESPNRGIYRVKKWRVKKG